MVGMGSSIPKRNLLTCSKRFMAFGTGGSGIPLMAVPTLIAKLQRRQAIKATNEYEQERAFMTNAVNNSNISF